MPRDKTLDVRPGGLDATSMRYHELWLQRWLYSRFFVREGYPVPVCFASPMDAFSHFSKLWADENNPFKYLLELKDDKGTPLYEPHPSPIRYPLISVMRKGLKYRPYQNFSIHRWRHVNWPTVSDPEVVPGTQQQGTDLVKCDLGNVTVSRMPMAWDYKFQIDHFCLRPDTQAFYLERLMRQFWRSGGGLQSWMDIEYPGWGQQYIRIYLDGEIDQSSPDDANFQESNVEFRTSFTLVIEGFDIDLDYQTVPALWKIVAHSAAPDALDRLLEPITVDLRTTGYNEVLESRPDIPSAGTCQIEGLRNQWTSAGTVYILLGDLAGTNPGDNVYDPNHDTPGYVTDPIFNVPRFSYGIPSSLVFGIPIFTSGSVTPVVVSGTVTPATAGISVEFPAVGTLAVDSLSGYYEGTLPYGYSGTALPHRSQSIFTPPVRVYTSLITDQPDQNYAWAPEIHFRGTDSASLETNFGNVPEYNLFNFVNPGALETTAYGTHALAAVQPFVGTNAGTLETVAFGEHLMTTVLVTPGTFNGTLFTAPYGASNLVVVSVEAGTGNGTLSAVAYGTYAQMIMAASGGTNFVGVFTTSPFGTYAPA